MHFELPEDEVYFDTGTGRVRIGVERFNQLVAYVEDLENAVLSMGQTLPDRHRPGKPSGLGQSQSEPDLLAPRELDRLAEFARLFQESHRLRAHLQGERISIRRLSELTRIPYTTLHRYLSGQVPPVDAASEILQAIAWESPKLRKDAIHSGNRARSAGSGSA